MTSRSTAVVTDHPKCIPGLLPVRPATCDLAITRRDRGSAAAGGPCATIDHTLMSPLISRDTAAAATATAAAAAADSSCLKVRDSSSQRDRFAECPPAGATCVFRKRLKRRRLAYCGSMDCTVQWRSKAGTPGRVACGGLMVAARADGMASCDATRVMM